MMNCWICFQNPQLIYRDNHIYLELKFSNPLYVVVALLWPSDGSIARILGVFLCQDSAFSSGSRWRHCYVLALSFAVPRLAIWRYSGLEPIPGTGSLFHPIWR